MSTTDDNTGQEGVFGRKLIFCEFLQQLDVEYLIRTCEDCGNFLVYCCSCRKRYGNDGRSPGSKYCHHFRLIFTDGACRNNGQSGATAGIGVAMGDNELWQQAIPITTVLDPGQKRTSQRAELLAALPGLRQIIDVKKKYSNKRRKLAPTDGEDCWIIATDSEYVVKGMTEWLPAWKNNNLRTNRNTKPANLDLFLQLDDAIAVEETKGVKIGFWHVPREYNAIADRLAKDAAQLGHQE
ncbi:MAG: hypothetical protein Q9171_004141 [Xanthocarpia ochracea]